MAKPAIAAQACLKPLPGGSGAHLYRVGGDRLFVVKFKASRQGKRIVLNDYVAGRLAEEFGLPIGRIALVNVPPALHPTHPNLHGADPGTQFGAGYFEGSQSPPPVEALVATHNFRDFAGVIVFDSWIRRGNSRQVLIYPSAGVGEYDRFAIFDHGYAFGGSPNWSAKSLAQEEAAFVLEDQYNFIRSHLKDAKLFRPYLERLSGFGPDVVRGILAELPTVEWEVTDEEVDGLVRFLVNRREPVARGIEALL